QELRPPPFKIDEVIRVIDHVHPIGIGVRDAHLEVVVLHGGIIHPGDRIDVPSSNRLYWCRYEAPDTFREDIHEPYAYVYAKWAWVAFRTGVKDSEPDRPKVTRPPKEGGFFIRKS